MTPFGYLHQLTQEACLEQAPPTELRPHLLMLYIEEFFNPKWRHIKCWFAACFVGGHLNWSHSEAMAEHITQAAWHEPGALTGLTVFPTVLTARYPGDRNAGFPQPVRLPLREMAFW